MSRFLRLGLILIFWLSACAPQPDSAPTAPANPTASPAPAVEIRFGLVGEPPQVNAWELFDGSGATHASLALFSGNFPRLYQLSPLDSALQPLAADGLPSDVIPDGEGYSATVKLRAGLRWTDGSPFTAADAAFTANASLRFELANDWGAYYPPNHLARAEAPDDLTVKFIFKQKPNVAVWQYGILQAPIVSKTFWEPLIQPADAQLPNAALRAQIAAFRAKLEVAQSDLDDLTAQVTWLRVNGLQNRKTEGEYTRMQGEVVYLQATLENLLEDYASQVSLAQRLLHDLDSRGEPTLGVWLPGAAAGGAWVKQADPSFPFGQPNFERAAYYFFEDEDAALDAYQNDRVDFILSPVADVPAGAKYNPTSSARFLVFNPANAALASPSVRAALNCVIDRNALAGVLGEQAAPLESFTLSPRWHDPNLKSACAGMDDAARLSYAVQVLKDAGYSWSQPPAPQTAGRGFSMPNGEAFPKVTLLAPSQEADALRYVAAKYAAERAQALGIPLAVQEVRLDEVVYAVYSSGKYDAALAGWRLAEYPAYLCDWFGGGRPSLYQGGRFAAICDTLQTNSDLETARQAVAQMEAALFNELPFLPLFSLAQADVYRNLSYPAPDILNGWTGWHGAPSLALPAR